MDAQLISKCVAPVSLALIMFSMGMTLKLEDFLRLSKQPRAFWIGLLTQICTPLLIASILIITLDIGPEISIGLIILAACPGGPGTNLLTFMCNGDVPLSLALSLACSLVIGVTIPLVVATSSTLFWSSPTSINGTDLIIVALQILTLTIAPIIAGMTVGFYKAQLAITLENKAKNIGLILLLFAVALICYDVRAQLFHQGIKTSFAIVTLCITCIALSYAISRLNGFNVQQARSIFIGTGFQNAALAFTVCALYIDTPESTIPAALYTPLTIPISVLLIFLLKRENNSSKPDLH
jgi:BASS family bile acid:Na+ symporter